jgi:hypothetical protein
MQAEQQLEAKSGKSTSSLTAKCVTRSKMPKHGSWDNSWRDVKRSPDCVWLIAVTLCVMACVLQDDLMDSPEVETMLKNAKHLKVTTHTHIYVQYAH